ncbi:protein of unknown function [Candidatus Nitrospira inopinata]|uniref:Uncharacterized protein n=1 Tax=Candidatus Nitrospira inopinata TaxID=1715989 RepID=A0A0S4KQZ0_9BACT|nr:protein of unknown function [Candidatus Nitrospira inopinata]
MDAKILMFIVIMLILLVAGIIIYKKGQ